ncbi:hypothetical protein Bpfe_012780 [Biomphalaria pfeifferi]|uniref:Uncharacterized protein n=1 Tax=Biomphalaria pfeifferi TaxID=112525 RepID=A0AAD8BND4_BIOPF|nr:hypothetical protein Bpfe_012780 [Biomphalaria pfeifferi]
MKNEDFIFGMRPECIFLNTQLGDKNPFLRNISAAVLPNGLSPKSKIFDTRDYESYPDLYWKLRSESVSQPEDMDRESIDRDLYRLQQATSLKLTTFDRTLLQEPFRNWRGKAGDLLFFPVTRKLRKKKAPASTERVLETVVRNSGSESTGQLLEIQATPIRKTFVDSFKTSDERTALSDDTDRGKRTKPKDNKLPTTDVGNDTSSCNSASDDAQRIDLDASNENRKPSYVENCVTGRSHRSTHTTKSRKEMVRPSVISVELGLTNFSNNLKPNCLQHLSVDGDVLSGCHSDEHNPAKTDNSNVDIQNQSVKRNEKLIANNTVEEYKSKDSDDEGRKENRSFVETENVYTENKLKEDVMKRSSTSAKLSGGKNSQTSIRPVHLEVFNERNRQRKSSRAKYISTEEIPGYKLDLLNYPPTKSPTQSKSAQAGSHQHEADVTGRQSARSNTKISKQSRRSSRSANSACLTITPCF